MPKIFSPSWNDAIHYIKSGMMIIRRDGTIDQINEPLKSMAEKHGISPGIITQGISLFELNPNEFKSSSYRMFFKETYLPSIRNILEGSEPDYIAEYSIDWHGKKMWVLCEAQPLTFNQGSRIEGAVISFSDITRFKKKEIRLEQALSLTCTLPGHVPICAVCKHVHTEKVWEPVESYLENRMPIEFTHDICPSCIRRLYPSYSSILDEDHASGDE